MEKFFVFEKDGLYFVGELDKKPPFACYNPSHAQWLANLLNKTRNAVKDIANNER